MTDYTGDFGGIGPQDAKTLRGRAYRGCVEQLEADGALCAIPAVIEQGPSSYDRGVLYLTDQQLVFVSTRGGHLSADLTTVHSTRVSMQGAFRPRPEFLCIDIGSGEVRFAVNLANPDQTLGAFLGYHEELRNNALSAASGGSNGGVSAADELAKFAALRDQGVISEEEFAQKKAQILAGS